MSHSEADTPNVLTPPGRRFEPYVEAQIWSDEPVAHLLRTPGAS